MLRGQLLSWNLSLWQPVWAEVQMQLNSSDTHQDFFTGSICLAALGKNNSSAMIRQEHEGCAAQYLMTYYQSQLNDCFQSVSLGMGKSGSTM